LHRGDIQLAGARRLRARDGDDAALEGSEQDCRPGGRVAEVDEQAVARLQTVRPEERGPSAGAVGQLPERPPVDDALVVDREKRRSVRVDGEILDDVPREVEPLAARVRIVYRLAAKPSHVSRYSSRTGLKTSITVAPSGPQYAECTTLPGRT